MRRLVLALTAIAVCAFAAVPIALAQHHHRHANRSAAVCAHRFHFKLTHANRARDHDRDGVTNAAECAHGTNPMKPNNSTATAATVKSFTPATATADAVLVIALPDGTTETGKVNDQTEIQCVAAQPTPTTPTAPTTPTTPMSSRHDGGGDDSGSGDDQPQGNQQGQGDDDGPGDDNGEDDDNNDNVTPCTTADLTVNAVINEAKLRVDATDGAVFREIIVVK